MYICLLASNIVLVEIRITLSKIKIVSFAYLKNKTKITKIIQQKQ